MHSNWSKSSEHSANSELTWVHTNWQFNMASRFPEIFPEARIAKMNEEATPLNTKRITKLGLVVTLELNFYFLILLVLLQYNYNIKVHIYMYVYSHFIIRLVHKSVQ